MAVVDVKFDDREYEKLAYMARKRGRSVQEEADAFFDVLLRDKQYLSYLERKLRDELDAE